MNALFYGTYTVGSVRGDPLHMDFNNIDNGLTSAGLSRKLSSA